MTFQLLNMNYTSLNSSNQAHHHQQQQQPSFEYIRSPHGIYTRVNTGDHEHSSESSSQQQQQKALSKSPSFRIIPASSSVAGAIPQSTSSFIISSSSLSKTTTASKVLTSHASSGSMNVQPSRFFDQKKIIKNCPFFLSVFSGNS